MVHTFWDETNFATHPSSSVVPVVDNLGKSSQPNTAHQERSVVVLQLNQLALCRVTPRLPNFLS